MPTAVRASGVEETVPPQYLCELDGGDTVSWDLMGIHPPAGPVQLFHHKIRPRVDVRSPLDLLCDCNECLCFCMVFMGFRDSYPGTQIVSYPCHCLNPSNVNAICEFKSDSRKPSLDFI